MAQDNQKPADTVDPVKDDAAAAAAKEAEDSKAKEDADAAAAAAAAKEADDKAAADAAQKKPKAKVGKKSYRTVHGGVLVHPWTEVKFSSEPSKPVEEDEWITIQVEAEKLVEVTD